MYDTYVQLLLAIASKILYIPTHPSSPLSRPGVVSSMGIFLSEYAWEVYLSYNTFMLTTHDAIQGPSTGFEPFIVATILPEYSEI